MWLRSYLNHRFEDDDLEVSFWQSHQRSMVQNCQLWAAIQVFYVLAYVFAGVLLSYYGDGAIWAMFSIPLVCGASLVAATHFGILEGTRLNNTLAFCHVLTLVVHSVQNWMYLVHFRDLHWNLPQNESIAASFAEELSTSLMILITHIGQYLQLVPLMQIGFGPAFLVADFAGPVSNVLLLVLAVYNQPALFLICALTFLSAVSAAAHCHAASKVQRAVFLLEVQKAHSSKQSQQADAMVNHILKNAMVEASGLIDVFLELCLPA
eukprot:EG_transcript_24346